MKFNDSVVMFEFAGFPLVGNKNTGFVIGLTESAAEICRIFMDDDASADLIIEEDENLFIYLEQNGFFDDLNPLESVTSAYFHVTQRCNLECVGCYSSDAQRNNSLDPTLQQLSKALDGLASTGVKTLIISGGEPFLREDLLEIVRYARIDCEMDHISIITNGTIPFNESLNGLEFLVEKIAISIDGYSSECKPFIRREQRFDQLVKTIKTIQEAGIPAHIIPTVHSRNIDDSAHYVQLADDLDVTMNFSLLSCSASDKEAFALLPTEDDLIKLGKLSLGSDEDQKIVFSDTPMSFSLNARRSCGAGGNLVSVASDGTVYPCHMLHDKELPMGNLFTDDPRSILEGTLRKKFLSLNVEEFKECNTCEIMHLCGGGCRARAFFSSGDITSKDSYCTMTKEFYKGFEDRLSKMREQ